MTPPGKTNRRQRLRGRQKTDLSLLETLRRHSADGWMSAMAVSLEHGMSVYSVQFALRRMASKGLVEEDIVKVVGKARPIEHTRMYRARPQPGEARKIAGGLPSWMAPQAVVDLGERRVVLGRSGIRSWDPDEDDQVDCKPGAEAQDL